MAETADRVFGEQGIYRGTYPLGHAVEHTLAIVTVKTDRRWLREEQAGCEAGKVGRPTKMTDFLRSRTKVRRTVLELITDEGVVGLGEVGGGDQRVALTKLKPRLVGLDPFHLEVVKLKVLRSIYYLSNARLYGAIEMACLDIQGKVLNRPMSDLLGGAVREKIPMIAYLFWRYDRTGGEDGGGRYCSD